MSKSKTSTTTFAPDIVFYAKRTGSELSCFDRYPDWLTNWLEANKNNLGFNCDIDNLPDLNLYNEAEELIHKFRLGDCVALTSQGVKVSFAAIYEILRDVGVINNIDTSSQVI